VDDVAIGHSDDGRIAVVDYRARAEELRWKYDGNRVDCKPSEDRRWWDEIEAVEKEECRRLGEEAQVDNVDI
jgi:hypothetical protein